MSGSPWSWRPWGNTWSPRLQGTRRWFDKVINIYKWTRFILVCDDYFRAFRVKVELQATPVYKDFLWVTPNLWVGVDTLWSWWLMFCLVTTQGLPGAYGQKGVSGPQVQSYTHTHTHTYTHVGPAKSWHLLHILSVDFISKINFLPPGRHWGSRCCRTDGLSRETSEFGTSSN